MKVKKISKRDLKKLETAQKIKYYFFEKEMSVTEVAKRVGISRQTIYNYLNKYGLIDIEAFEKERERRKQESKRRKIEYIKNYIKNKRLQKRVQLLKKECAELLEKGVISESDIWFVVSDKKYLDSIVAMQHYKDSLYLSFEERRMTPWTRFWESIATCYKYIGGGKYVRMDSVNGALVPTCLPKIIKSPNFAGRRRKGRTDITAAQEAIA
ncbi:Resolvase helix-turn-helix domain protein [Caldicellulosiruptor saccharolyticus DSM 8903]|uniref:Resolvase helix-turn-helix domain protein n=1 Tax=Caldicellulosiruptor saccharolyticus (strain ATCC 43494 / DSM 8903 / Tp8T 6331) TaxID=351627 RepID=A4XJ96_CALS8|nr:helix-turn-helix domain-containing protein [Caldicellulosiruptor saccharolyticus]ABP66981.1 Resolvase helix-turn-helix domain protein [Caldicellulosiruptor saccharolyticus DSM 8903]